MRLLQATWMSDKFCAAGISVLVIFWLLVKPATAQNLEHFASGEIELVGTISGKLVIKVEFASDEAQRRQGLMYREELPARTGMLFIYEGEGMRAFWMKNTSIELDMVFFDGAGKFVSLQRDVPPLTLDAAAFNGAICVGVECRRGRGAWDRARNATGPPSSPLALAIARSLR